MPDVHPGSHKYSNSQSIPYELGSDAAQRGDALAVGAAGSAVLTTGSNGFLGVLQTATAADYAADALPVGALSEVASGDEVSLAVAGAVRANVSAFDSGSGGTVSAGEAIAAGADGALVTVDDGGGSAVKGDVGEPRALSDASGDGFAVVFLG